jgi:hypothetical protein
MEYWISSRGEPTWGGPPAWGLGVGLTPLCKKSVCYGNVSQGLGLGLIIWNDLSKENIREIWHMECKGSLHWQQVNGLAIWIAPSWWKSPPAVEPTNPSALCLLLHWLNFRPWRRREYVTPKVWHSSAWLHGVTSKKIMYTRQFWFTFHIHQP